MDIKAKPVKERGKRNNEKRKEKSRDAARCRRSRETEIFTDLAQAIPLPKEATGQLDKASIMRLAISYLRVRDMVTLLPELPEKDDKTDESVFLQALEGFLLVISADGDLVYVSENISEYLGITQVDLMGQNIFEYSHPCDHDEIKEIITGKSTETNNLSKSFFIRLKCTLTSKGRSVNLKSATYKVIHCTGHMVNRGEVIKKEDEKSADITKPAANLEKCLVAIGQPIPHPSNIEVPLDKTTFLTKHSLDMKFTYADDSMLDVLGYEAEDLIGKSVYEYHHAMDSDMICQDFRCLFSKGQCETGQYRFLAKSGGFARVLTQATLIHDKMQKPQSVVCVNYVISGIECKDEIYASHQLAFAPVKIKCENNNTVCEKVKEVPQIVNKPQTVNTAKVLRDLGPVGRDPAPVALPKLYGPAPGPSIATRPQTATSKLFAPRTEEMNKGFLMFSDEEPGLTMLKDEPEDLTHLAPTAGDVCVPLDDCPLITDMLNDFLGENYCPLFADDLHSLDSECSKNSDPFISYRDDYDDTTNSTNLLSPSLSSKSPDNSAPSLSSPGNSLGEDDHMNTFISIQMDEDESDLALKAPYIPMTGGDDFPLLTSNDLMWNAIPNAPKTLKNNKSPDLNSSLAHLLCSSVNKPPPKNIDHGGGLLENRKNKEAINSIKSNTDWNSKMTEKTNNQTTVKNNNNERSNHKRTHNSSYDYTSKRSKNSEPKEKLHQSELLHQLITNNNQRQKTKGKNNWLLNSNGKTAACVSQPSDSVLMNLLGNNHLIQTNSDAELNIPIAILQRNSGKPPDVTMNYRQLIRKNSGSLINPNGAIPSLLELTQQDFEVNAPVNNFLLHGQELLTALDINEGV